MMVIEVIPVIIRIGSDLVVASTPWRFQTIRQLPSSHFADAETLAILLTILAAGMKRQKKLKIGQSTFRHFLS